MHRTAYIYVVANAIWTPFQGDFLVRVVPRAEALGCFLFPVGRLELAQENVQTPASRTHRANSRAAGHLDAMLRVPADVTVLPAS
jgi:hypothetical protein